MNIKRELKNSRIIMIKEFKQLFRKKVLFVPLFIFPIVMIVFFGYGMGGSVNNVGMLIVNNDMGVSSNALIQELGTFIPKNSDNKMFEITYTKDMAQSEAEDKINSGQFKAVLIIPADYSNSLAKNEKPEVILLTDQSDTTSSGIIIETMNRILSESQPGTILLVVPDIYGNLKYIDFLTPAVIALTVFFGTVMSTGYAVAGEREDGTIVRILMTPISRGAVILGKTIHQLILQLARAVILILAAILIFGVKMNGSWFLVALILIIFTFGAVGMGIAISAKSEDMTSFQQISMLFTLPSMFATGVFFPLDSVPDWMRWIAYFIPLTYANDAMRIVMIKGQGINAIAGDLIILLIFSIIIFAVAIRIFRREV
ncbi:MAG TPA: ABC transporter permease [Candidatus Methanoperedens sp.]|nr:ABC transporter permease [Candidatus Methanoperedens sp.]